MPATLYVAHAERVEAIATSEGFLNAEHYIEHLDVDADTRSALWLVAWSVLPPDEQRRMAAAFLDEQL